MTFSDSWRLLVWDLYDEVMNEGLGDRRRVSKPQVKWSSSSADFSATAQRA
jgi:hypothetical protein